MQFAQKLQTAVLLRRYKRFLADVQLPNGEVLTLHCPNTGSMKNCLAPGAPVWFSRSDNAKRKYPCTWEIATTPAGHLAGINTGRANALVREALEAGLIPSIGSPDAIRAEVRYGEEGSRVDFVATSGGRDYFIEVKSVTLCEAGGVGFFPDAISARGARHLRELALLTRQGAKAVLIYCVQHTGIERVCPAAHIDPAYAQAFDEAVRAGVEVWALGASISDTEIVLDRPLPVAALKSTWVSQ